MAFCHNWLARPALSKADGGLWQQAKGVGKGVDKGVCDGEDDREEGKQMIL